ncbi:MAG: hypothetical protein CL677_07790 [Bdellovibrionaceae bacterium]|nr:hypothetical protein [Pseudobdellovibrionaceae bacterium]|tara:strand:- start:254 stop:670 length:417 start_codon:yes stop_codon:yes gene_type:complete
MKKIILAFLVASLYSTVTLASDWGAYDESQLKLTNKLFELCPNEASKILSQRYTEIVRGSYVRDSSTSGIMTNYIFEFKQSLPGPSFAKTSWTMNVYELIKSNPNYTEETPYEPTISLVNCSLQEVETDEEAETIPES